jgi:uncharacterized protein (TIGR02996 family)
LNWLTSCNGEYCVTDHLGDSRIKPGGDTVTGSQHMPYLQAIWRAPLEAFPLLRYADWLETVGHGAAAAYYRVIAEEVAWGRVRPDYTARSWVDDWDDR